jgi:hypothetical protein
VKPRRDAAYARVRSLLDAARAVAGPGAARRRELVQRLEASSGLSLEGVEWALSHCLELDPSETELLALLDGVPEAPRAHVLLPARVCVAPLRALAVALAASPRVYVRASRREPVLTEALSRQAPDLFQRVERLAVAPGDHVWAFGADETLEVLRGELPPGALLHANGSGFGIAIVELGSVASAIGGVVARAAAAIAEDTLAFDQQGCLSPRLVFVLGGYTSARALAVALAEALADAGRRVPRGRLTLDELGDATWYRHCASCFGEVFDTAHGLVSLRSPEPGAVAPVASANLSEVIRLLPPPGRNLEIIPISSLEAALPALAAWITSAACSEPELALEVRRWLPRARICELGRMQRPPLDGPVDRRPDPAGERITERATVGTG